MSSVFDRKAWAGRRVLVTGTTGFKGAWLAALLCDLGAEVVGVALPPTTEPSLYRLLGLDSRIDQRMADLREPCLEGILGETSPDVVFHLAAQALVRRGFAEPALTYDTNTMATVRTLEAVRNAPGVRAVVNVTTDKVYLDIEGPPHEETGRLGGHGPYSGSKVCSEVITASAYRSWARARGLGLATARSGNTLGGGDWAEDRLVPDCVRAVVEGQPVRIRNPDAVRPWQHALDVLFGYLVLAEQLLIDPEGVSGPWNFGPTPGGEPTVEVLARAFLEDLGRPEALLVQPEPGAPPETGTLRLDSGKARAQLGWHPQLAWRESIQWTARWYQGWREGKSASLLCERDMADYLSRIDSLARAPRAGESRAAEWIEQVGRPQPNQTIQTGVAPAASSTGDGEDEALAAPGLSREQMSTEEGSEWLCRFCDTALRQSVIDLGKAPLANSFVPHSERNAPELFRPLRAYVCHECFLVQVPEFARAESIFADYLYFSSYSSSWLDHARNTAEELRMLCALDAGSRVVEVASNDGYLLRNLVDAGIPCLGIEPAANVAQVAIAAGVPTRVAFFGDDLAGELVAEGGAADLVIGINVLAHVPDLRGFVAGLSRLLADDGLLLLEVPHLLALLRDGLFDTIYHEHYSYFSLHTLQRVLGGAGLQIRRLRERNTHGGSLSLYVCHEKSNRYPLDGSVDACLLAEQGFGILDVANYGQLQSRAESSRADLLAFLVQARRDGKRVVGYGAPAKGNTLLNFCGVRRDLLPCTADISPHKQGTWLPGTEIPVLSPREVLDTRPDYVLILPWNLRDEIELSLKEVRAWGGQFVVALPSLEVF